MQCPGVILLLNATYWLLVIGCTAARLSPLSFFLLLMHKEIASSSIKCRLINVSACIHDTPTCAHLYDTLSLYSFVSGVVC